MSICLRDRYVKEEVTYQQVVKTIQDRTELIGTCTTTVHVCDSHGNYCANCIRNSYGSITYPDNLNKGKEWL